MITVVFVTPSSGGVVCLFSLCPKRESLLLLLHIYSHTQDRFLYTRQLVRAVTPAQKIRIDRLGRAIEAGKDYKNNLCDILRF